MKRLAGTVALCVVAALAACDRAAVEQKTTDMTRGFMEMRGLDYDMRLEPASPDDRGPLVVTRTQLTFEDGTQIPLYQVDDGIYRTPSLRTRYGARGSAICGGQPVAYLTLHRGPGDLYYLNAGNWSTAPTLPGHDSGTTPGACETTAYRPGATAS